MKYFGKYGRLLVSIALNRANVGETLKYFILHFFNACSRDRIDAG
jgi:hypothetical protein